MVLTSDELPHRSVLEQIAAIVKNGRILVKMLMSFRVPLSKLFIIGERKHDELALINAIRLFVIGRKFDHSIFELFHFLSNDFKSSLRYSQGKRNDTARFGRTGGYRFFRQFGAFAMETVFHRQRNVSADTDAFPRDAIRAILSFDNQAEPVEKVDGFFRLHSRYGRGKLPAELLELALEPMHPDDRPNGAVIPFGIEFILVFSHEMGLGAFSVFDPKGFFQEKGAFVIPLRLRISDDIFKIFGFVFIVTERQRYFCAMRFRYPFRAFYDVIDESSVVESGLPGQQLIGEMWIASFFFLEIIPEIRFEIGEIENTGHFAVILYMDAEFR
jgi:hypothetical protein